MQNDLVACADFLIDQKILHECPLVARELYHLAHLLVGFLYRTIAFEIFLEGLANSFDVEVVRQPLYCGDTFPPITLSSTEERGPPATRHREDEDVW